MIDTRTLLDGLVFPESPRWYDGKLWFVDMFGQKVMTVTLDGHAETVGQFDDRPSGIGFLPDGTALVVLMRKKQIVEVESQRIHADLSSLDGAYLNDMVVDRQGRAYVDLLRSVAGATSSDDADDAIILVKTDGTFRPAGDFKMNRPNGLVITPDGQTLVVAMRPKHELVAFSVAADGLLSNPRTYADLGAEDSDGICLDAEGAVWVATLQSGLFLRVRPGGQVAETVSAADDRWAVACVLGGKSRKTLFMATAEMPGGAAVGQAHERHGFIEIADVEVAGAGVP